MRIGLVSSMMVLLAGLGPAQAQPPSPPVPSSRPMAPGDPAGYPGARPARDVTPYGLGPASTTLVPGSPAVGPLAAEAIAADAHHDDCVGGPDNGGCLHDGRRWYGGVEYLLWKVKDAPLPPQQLTVPFSATGTNATVFGVFSLADGATLDVGARSGGRLTLGYWVNPDQSLGLEANYFQFERRAINFTAAQVTNLPLAVTVNQIIPTSVLSSASTTLAFQTQVLQVTLPGELRVRATGYDRISNFLGAEANARSRCCFIGGAYFDFLGGFRYLNFDEDFFLSENINVRVGDPVNLTGPGPIPPNPLPPIPPPLTNVRDLMTIVTVDNVSTKNRFYGAQVGTSFDWWFHPRWVVNGFAKVAAGGMTQDVTITGFTTTTASPTAGAAPITTVAPGGLLTPITGVVNNSRTRYAWLPELNINLGYQLTDALRLTFGYNFLYVSNIIRPAEQVGFSSSSTTVTIAGQPTATTINQPSFHYTDTDLWAQGITAGLQFRY